MIYLFWLSVLAIVYAYVGYPLLLWVITRFKHGDRQVKRAAVQKQYHQVTFIISAYNEVRVIEEKIANTLALDYPRDLFEIVVVSDGSDDGTDEIVGRYADRGVILRRYEGRMGKTACLNMTVPCVSGEIIVFSDANSQYDRNAIKALIAHFEDPKIGFVTGSTRYLPEDGSRMIDAIGIYSRIELITKKLEGRISSCVGADGAIFAIRRDLYPQLRTVDINDLVIPLVIVKQGLRGIFEENAHCSEKTAKNARAEFRRQVRITNRTIRALVHHRDLLNPLRHGMFAFQLASHKLSKLLTPYFLVLLLLSSAMLAGNGPMYATALAGQAVVYFLAWISGRGRSRENWPTVVAAAATFVTINAAMLNGWIKFFLGETYTSWKTVR